VFGPRSVKVPSVSKNIALYGVPYRILLGTVSGSKYMLEKVIVLAP